MKNKKKVKETNVITIVRQRDLRLVSRQSLMNFIRELSAKNLRRLLKMESFKELIRDFGIPVAEELE